MNQFEILNDHTQQQPGDILEYRCPQFGLVWQWRIVAVRLGPPQVQSFIDVIPLTDSAPDTDMPLAVPAQMARHLTIIRHNPDPNPATGSRPEV